MEAPMKKWQCTVCGYIHTGEEPPEICPVCGADKSKFIEITEKEETPEAEKTAEKKPEKEAKPSKAPSPSLFTYEAVTGLMVKHHLHPITVHFPNGIVPMAVVFIFLAVIFQFAGLAAASFYSMIFVVLTLPVALFTGYNEWQKKYQGAMTRIFKIKIIAALVVTASAVIIVLWRLLNPGILQTSSSMRTGFLILHLILLAATAIAGYIGGKLVFKD